MKINETPRVGALHSYHKQRDHMIEHGNKGKAKMKDAVEISQEAKELLENQKIATSGSNDPQRTQRLEQLKHAIQSGTYEVDAHKVAEKLLPYIHDK